MDANIVKLIRIKAYRKLREMTECKREGYIKTAYSGLRYICDGNTYNEIGEEVGYNKSSIHKTVARWNELLEDGDITANLIQAAYLKFKTYKNNPEDYFNDETAIMLEENDKNNAALKEEEDVENIVRSDMTKVSRRKGYKFKLIDYATTEEEERMESEAIRDAIRFMADFGKGVKPRIHGEYFTPGTNPNEDNRKWLQQGTAARYCGCSLETLSQAASQGLVLRRAYYRTTTRTYWEYELGSLDEFVGKFKE